MKKQRIYLSGKITGYPDYRQVFDAAEQAVTRKGVKVLNPARMWGIFQPIFDGLPYSVQLILDLCVLASCDKIAYLPNWKYSNGALVEHSFADALKLKTIYL